MNYLSILIILILTSSFRIDYIKKIEKGDINIKLKTLRTNYSIDELKSLVLIIENNGKDAVCVPEFLYQGDSFDGTTELVFDIKIRQKGKYIPLNSLDNIQDYLQDYQRILSDRKLLSIKAEDTLSMIERIDVIYSFKLPGDYKIRAQVKIKCNNSNFNLFSNWVKIRVL